MKTYKFLFAIFGFLGVLHQAAAQIWTQTSAPTEPWNAIACSADGTRIIASATAGGASSPVYFSTNSGLTWATNSLPVARWFSLASSADGSRLIAANINVVNQTAYGSIYTSTDYGVTWVSNNVPSVNWHAVASSADGSRFVAAAFNDYIYTTTNSGATWFTNNVPSAGWFSVASSADGTKLVAVNAGGGIYTTTNSGATWVAQNAPNQVWGSVASSSDGTKLVASTGFYNGGGSIYTSTDSGVTWKSNNIPAEYWWSVCSSADGTRLMALAANTIDSNGYYDLPGQIFTSADSGTTWVTNNISIASNQYWSAGTCSADGTELIAACEPGGIYTATNNQLPPSADLTVGVSAPATVFAASNLTYAISITNFGPTAAGSVVVTDTLPAGVTFVNASGGGTANAGMVNWSLGTLNSNQVVNLTLTVRAPAGVTLTNSASVSSATPDPNLANNTSPQVITLVTLPNVMVSFAPAVNYVVNSPANLAAADVNGDGKIDLICANLTSPGTQTILTNNGSGGFAIASMPMVGNDPVVAAVADINGDGKVDLISADWGIGGGNTLTVLTNNGNGVFGSNGTYTVGAGPIWVTAADIIGNGKLDLITANFGNDGGNTLTVLTNNGSGVFGFNATYTVGLVPVEVIAADINGDGKLDLITANSGNSLNPGNTLTVLTNNGNGVFGFNATYIVGNEPYSVTAADVNGDGKLDLISANASGTLTVLTNDGSGGFVFNATYTAGNRPDWVTAADINGDGKLDLICVNSFSGTLTVLTNNGSGGFVLATTLSVGSNPNAVIAADVNGDGKLDLICANGNNTISVLINTTTFPPPTNTPTASVSIQGTGMLVSWPSASPGWSLWQNPDLTTGNWGPSGYSGYTISDDSTNKSLFIPSQPGNLFFRLLHP